MLSLLLQNAELRREQEADSRDAGNLLDCLAMITTTKHANVICLGSLRSLRIMTPFYRDLQDRAFGLKVLFFIKGHFFCYCLFCSGALKISWTLLFWCSALTVLGFPCWGSIRETEMNFVIAFKSSRDVFSQIAVWDKPWKTFLSGWACDVSRLLNSHFIHCVLWSWSSGLLLKGFFVPICRFH